MLGRFAQYAIAFLRKEDGPTAVEYAVVLALIIAVIISVSNIGNTRAPLYPTNSSNPGLFYPIGGNISNLYEDMGRYFTIGLRGNF